MAALHTLLAFLFFSFVVLNHSGGFVNAQALIPPARFDGFVYKNRLSTDMDSIIIEAFLDPVCPDSRDSWPPLKRAVDYYGSHVSLVVHPFALPFVNAQALIPPARFDGFVYKNRLSTGMDSIIIKAFLDPVCPDSRDSWPPLKRAVDYYGSPVSLVVHPFALPYHDNAFVSSRALHIANKLNASATYDLLELFFKHQEVFYSQATFNMSRAKIVSQIVNLATTAVGNSYQSAVASGFTDRKTDLMTRVSFKYGCSRGVFGAPFFFVNGFALPDGDSIMNYAKWRSIIDPLLKEQAMG